MEFVSYDIESNDFRRAGAASRAIKEHLKRVGADADAIRRTMIAAYEAEMNVVIHSVGGRLEASLADSRIDVNVIDEGPGIADIDLAMTEGYSTASAEARALGFGAGMGLPNIKRSSDRLRVTSRVGEGTRVSFTVFLGPGITCAAPAVSLYASADRCRDCRACLNACPTQALRVRDGRPMVLEHLCIDCTQCIAACTSGALTVRDVLPSVDDIADRERTALVIPPALLAGCGADYPPGRALAGLERLGFTPVSTVAPFEKALRGAALGLTTSAEADDSCARGRSGEAAPRTTAGATLDAHASGPATPEAQPSGPTAPEAQPWGVAAPEAQPSIPVIVPMCPAVVNLVELRFPSLVGSLAPFDSPWEAVGASSGGRALACVVSCPSQRSALAQSEQPPAPGCDVASIDCMLPEAVRRPLMRQLTGGGAAEAAGVAEASRMAGSAAVTESATVAGSAGVVARTPAVEQFMTPSGTDLALAGGPASADVKEDGLLVVSGIRHVAAVLEEIENGLLEDVTALEAYACEGGCFGSPLLFEDHHVAERRWARGKAPVEAAEIVARSEMGHSPAAVPRRRPYAARPGIRLDPDMGRAIHKLGRLQAITRSLPGRDCGACGAPTCAALAEDVVMERAGIELCPYIACEEEDTDL